MSDRPSKSVTFKVSTTAPGYKITFEGEALSFTNNVASIDIPIGWDCLVYYELDKPQKGDTLTLEISETSRPLQVEVTTDSQSFFGFTGFVISA